MPRDDLAQSETFAHRRPFRALGIAAAALLLGAGPAARPEGTAR